MASIQLTFDGSAQDLPAGSVDSRPFYRVQTRAQWTDKWRDQPFLEVLECRDCAAPDVPHATFRWRFGYIKQQGMDGYDGYDPADLLDSYIRISVIPPRATDGQSFVLWTGIVVEEMREDQGVGERRATSDASGLASDGQIPQALGDQRIIARGLVYLLQRSDFSSAPVLDVGDDSDEPTVNWIQIPLIFNDEYAVGLNDEGNKSPAKVQIDPDDEDSPEAYAFLQTNSDLFISQLWTVHDIVEHLVKAHGPDDVPFRVGGQTGALDQLILPSVDVRGMDLFAAINHVIDRRLGLGWKLKVGTSDDPDDPDGNIAEVHVFTLTDEAITLDSATMPANPSTLDLDIGSMHHLPQRVRIDRDSKTRFDRIRVQGERIVTMFTVSFPDNTLEAGWTPSEENDYKHPGANLSGTVPAKGLDRLRGADVFKRVFTTFVIPDNWNWMAGNGEGPSGAKRVNANPGLTLTGQFDANNPPPVRNWGHTLLRHLPLHDAESSSIDGLKEFRAPLAWIRDNFTKEFRPMHRVEAEDNVACSLRMLDRGFGFAVEAPEARHVLALNHWDQTLVSHFHPVYDYTTIVATVAARTDMPLRVQVDLTPEPAGDRSRELTIDVPGAEFWYCVPGTVLDIDPDDGGFIHADDETLSTLPGISGFILRDDGDRLRAIAAQAQAWYGEEHAALSLSFWGILPYQVGTFIGSLINDARSDDINTVISEVFWDIEHATTTIRTSYIELEFAWQRRAPRSTLT